MVPRPVPAFTQLQAGVLKLSFIVLKFADMKYFRLILVVLFLIPVIVSCQKVHRYKIAFDASEVHFGQEGGSRTLSIVEGSFNHMDVPKISGSDYPPFEGDGTNYLKRDWIELRKHVDNETESLEITVQENTSGEARYAHVAVSCIGRDGMTTVKVYQE